MISPFSNDIKQVIYNLLFLPSEDDLQISSSGTNRQFIENIIDEISCKESEKSFSKDFIGSFLILNNGAITIWELIYPDDDKEYNNYNLQILRNYSVINTIETIVTRDNNNDTKIEDKSLMLISSKYIQYLTKKYGVMERYSKLIDYIAAILYNDILFNLNCRPYYGKGVLINGRKYNDENEYITLAIIYFLFCKYFYNDILLKKFYNSIESMKLFESYDDFVEQNTKIYKYFN